MRIVHENIRAAGSGCGPVDPERVRQSRMAEIQFLGAIRKRSDLSFAQFSDHWLRVHRALMLPLVHAGYLTGYVQNLRITASIPGLESDLDGAPELSIRDDCAFSTMIHHENFVEANEIDTPRFVAMPAAASVVLRAGRTQANAAHQASGAKLMLFVHAIDGARECLQRVWQESPAPIVMPHAQPVRVLRVTATPATDAPYFGCESSWWEDVDALATAWATRLAPAAMNALGIASMWVLSAEEHVVVASDRPPLR